MEYLKAYSTSIRQKKQMNFIIGAIAITCAQALSLTPAEQEQAELMQSDRTIIGFLFEGFDFGDLWVSLSDDQREAIKTSVFNQALEFGGFDSKDFKNLEFEGFDEEMQAMEDEAIEEQLLAQWGCGGCCGPRFGCGCGPCGPFGGCCGPFGGFGGPFGGFGGPFIRPFLW